MKTADLMAQTKELKPSLHCKASEVKVGDNVWEHNIVTSIKEVRNHVTEEKFILFNGEAEVASWFARPSDQVMVTHRIQ